MRGDFSRVSFNPARGFSRVLRQQGRVTVDADDNEEQAINLHLVRRLAADLIGQHGGPGESFRLDIAQDAAGRPRGLIIAAGSYYVDGWLCENAAAAAWRKFDEDTPVQPWLTDLPTPEAGTYIAYLDVWERHVSALEADRAGDIADPHALREVALDGPDTASRAQVVWQVRFAPFDAGGGIAQPPRSDADWAAFAETWRPAGRGRLQAKAAEPSGDMGNPCEVSPRSRYRGIENQLYRVEVRSGGAANPAGTDNLKGATFAWSRENGAVIFPVDTIEGPLVKLADTWRDERFGIAKDDIVELADPNSGFGMTASRLYRVDNYDPDAAIVTLAETPDENTDDPHRPVVLRRWDHGDAPKLAGNAVPLVEDSWISLEDGIQIRFEKLDGPASYRSGDHWLIPARVVLGDVLWPRDRSDQRNPLPQEPHGIERHTAPLASVTVGTDGSIAVDTDLTRHFQPLAT